MTVSETPFKEIFIALVRKFLIESLSVRKYPVFWFRTTKSSKYVVNIIAAKTSSIVQFKFYLKNN